MQVSTVLCRRLWLLVGRLRRRKATSWTATKKWWRWASWISLAPALRATSQRVAASPSSTLWFCMIDQLALAIYIFPSVWISIAGSFSRTAVNASAGCKTTVSNVVMAIVILVSLELLTSLLYYTPIAVLASIILSALPGLVDIKEACNIWRVDKMDFLACIGAFLGVLFGSVEIGLLAAVRVLDPSPTLFSLSNPTPLI